MRMHPVSRALLGCGLTLLLTASVGLAQDAKLPDGLKHVPLDAMGFIHIRAGDFLKSDLGKTLLQELRKDRKASKGLKEIEKTLGLEAADLESVTLLMLAPPTRSQMGPWDGPGFGRKKAIYDKNFPVPEMKKPEPKFENEKIEEKKKAAVKEAPVLFQERDFRELLQRQDLDRHMHDHDMDFIDDFGHGGPLVIVTSAKPLDRKKILRALVFNSKPRDPFGPPMADGPSVLFLSDRTVMLGSPWELARYSEAMARKPKRQPLKSALALGAESHLIVAGGQLPADIRRMAFSPYTVDLRGLAAISPLLVTEAGLALDLGKSVDMKFQFNAATEESAAIALQAVKSLRVLAELAIEKSREVGESGGAKLELEKALIRGLAEATIEQKGTTVHAHLNLELGPTFYKKYMKDIVAQFRSRGDRTRSVNNLKQIALAFHGYHDATKTLPPVGFSSIKNADGKALLSWRVAILPYIEEENLYRQFDLDQPWDHPTNKKLIAKMPQIYILPGADAKEGETHYRVLDGPGSMFETTKGANGRLECRYKLHTIPDGSSYTIMVVEAKDPTIWTRPDDLPFNLNGPLPKFGVWPDGFHVALADGTVRFIRSTISEKTLRHAICVSDGNVLGPDWNSPR